MNYSLEYTTQKHQVYLLEEYLFAALRHCLIDETIFHARTSTILYAMSRIMMQT